ncbi:MAG: CDGSH iron-sulfur domain-containing protein [Magnetococcus sp. DMHC-6]
MSTPKKSLPSAPMYQQKQPYSLTVKADEKVFLCLCGHSTNPPHCSGQHKQINHPGPLAYQAQQAETLYLCGCGSSNNLPWCDGTHKDCPWW